MNLEGERPKHDALLLGLGRPWEVQTVARKLQEKKVEMELGWPWGAAARCPEGGRACSLHDGAPERTWRHRDPMPFTTVLRARTPRANCPEHGVKTMAVPWAAPPGRCTLLFERLAVEVLRASGSVRQGCALMGLGWETAPAIMRRAVARGREQRPLEGLQHLGMEEKSFKRGQSSSTLLTDWDQSRVRDVVEERTSQAADPLWATRTPEQKQAVEAVAVDLGAPFIQTMAKPGPGADLVPDQFHVSQDLGAAVDKVRRAEPKALMAQGDATRKGLRQRGLYHPQNFSPEPAPAFCARQDLPLKVARAWAAKELFAKFWADPSEGWARRFFPDGFGWVSRRRLQPVIEVARMRKRHPDHLLTYLRHPMTNAVTEGLNSKSQRIKAAARGFRSFRHYRIRILFFCGKLNLYPL